MMDASTDTGAVVTGLVETIAGNRSTLVVTFNEPLDPASAEHVANYTVKNVNARGSIPVLSASYDAAAQAVTLRLARPTPTNRPVAVTINGGITGLTGADGVLFDGDNDQQPGGNYIALLTVGRSINFLDVNADRANVRLIGPGLLELVQLPNGNPTSLLVSGGVGGRTTLTGSVRPGPSSTGVVTIPELKGTENVNNALPYPAFNVTRAPAVANASNFPYTIQVTRVTIPDLLGVQSAVTAESGGDGLIFGGRTNGLHGFSSDPNVNNFPPDDQNTTIQVVDPTTGQVWSRDWSTSGLPASVTDPLTSTAQEFLQVGNTLYVIGGYGNDSSTGQMVTFDTLTAINVPALIQDVKSGASLVNDVRQTQDYRLRVTGGDLGAIGNRFYLVFGQDFEGEYSPSTPNNFTQIYTNTIGSFQIVDQPGVPLGIAAYSAQVDPVNFRRRDGNLHAFVTPSGQPGLEYDGGVFTPGNDGTGYRNPVIIGPDGVGRVDFGYQQYFSQYDSPMIPLFSASTGAMQTVFLGGIGLFHYDPTTGQLSEDTNLPFTPDITTQVTSANGLKREYILQPQLPGFFGAEAAFFQNPSLPTYANGVIQYDKLSGPTVLGYMYGGIESTAANTFQGQPTFATPAVFLVTLMPNGK